MAISITGGTPKEVVRFLELLQDYNAYKERELFETAPIYAEHVQERIDFFSGAQESPNFEPPEYANEMVQEGDESTVAVSYKHNGLDYVYTAGLAINVYDPLRDSLLRELLYHEGAAFNPDSDEEVFTNIGTALNTLDGKSNILFKEAEEFAERRENGILAAEKELFYSFRDKLAAEAKRAHETVYELG